MNKNSLQKEWDSLLKKEHRVYQKHRQAKVSNFQDRISKWIPSGLQDKLNFAFIKGFKLVFDKGIVIIEKTYEKDKYEQDYKINEYAATVRQNRKSIKTFTTKAQVANTKNKLITGVEGIVLGVAGIGLPDIPLFIGVLLKSIYEIALSYGFQYKSDEEKVFILKLIETSMCYGENYTNKDNEVDELINTLNSNILLDNLNLNQSIEETAKVLSDELLYMKFIQGIPIAGILGGISDLTCHHTVTEYAMIKYQKRFLQSKLDNNNI